MSQQHNFSTDIAPNSQARSSQDPAPTTTASTYNSSLITGSNLIQLGDTPDKNEWPSGFYFGDGSGGRYSSYPTLRRCGTGIAYLDWDMDHQYDIWSPLPGAIQTVPRAELYALLIVVHHVRPNARVHFFTDSKNTRDTYYRGQPRAALAANADLWVSLFHQIEAKSLKVHVYWMPSHTDTEPAKLEKAPTVAQTIACAWQ